MTQPLNAAIAAATRAIPPAWPLAATVAVNPFLGQTHETLAEASARLTRTTGARATMPRSWYRDQIAAGKISDGDLEEALASAGTGPGPKSLAALKAAASRQGPALRPLPLVADLAAAASGTDWPGFIAERIGAWVGGHFDEGQALWAAPKATCAYAAWRAAAIHDLTPEIAGLRGFARHVAEAPERAQGLIARVVARLGLAPETAEHYFHQLLMSLGGWAQYARYLLWQAELGGGSDDTLTGLLAIRLLWEEALFLQHEGAIAAQWADVRSAHAKTPVVDEDFVVDAMLQDAAERAAQRRLAQSLSTPSPQPSAMRPALQAAFCIDVRSEVFRRALESLNPEIATIGFAGFFGLPTAHRRFASDSVERRLPVLLNPALHSSCTSPELQASDQGARFKARAKRAWGRFKLAAVSSFAFVEATGPVYAGKLVSDALALKPVTPPSDPKPHLAPAPDVATRVKTAEAVLKAMGLTRNFARLVLIAGHGAQVTNNPHASALQCGACGGYSGEVNARLLASLLNDPGVRQGLATAGLGIPADTLFLGALHDTTADSVTLYLQDQDTASHKADLDQASAWLKAAGQIARTERAQHLPRASAGGAVARRSRDWAETRPEWGLAGCQAFIAAPRLRTTGKSLEGRAFLHDYDWKQDRNFAVLELIMTAPVVVASWISLQYYGSTVAPQVFGGGNKLLHNVCGGIGVLEGNGGVLRAGLPWQSVHDGARFIHEPLRLSVCIEAPREAMSDILSRHEGLRALFDKGWLHLFALDEQGHMAWRYAEGLRWARMEAVGEAPGLKQAV